MLAASCEVNTASFDTLQNIAIFFFMPGSIGRSQRQMRMSGWMPISRSFCTECCVGLVLSSPAAAMYGTSVRCTLTTFCVPCSMRSWRNASMNGKDSMSPTVPPTSTINTSLPSAQRRMFSLIASVMCGMTCTVPPR